MEVVSTLPTWVLFQSRNKKPCRLPPPPLRCACSRCSARSAFFPRWPPRRMCCGSHGHPAPGRRRVWVSTKPQTVSPSTLCLGTMKSTLISTPTSPSQGGSPVRATARCSALQEAPAAMGGFGSGDTHKHQVRACVVLLRHYF